MHCHSSLFCNFADVQNYHKDDCQQILNRLNHVWFLLGVRHLHY